MPQDPKYFQQFPHEENYFSQFQEESFTPIEKVSNEPGMLSKGLDLAGQGVHAAEEFVNQHPALKRFFFGPSKEDLDGRELTAEGTGPGEIPGLRTGAEYLRNKMINSGDYLTGYTGGLIKEFGPGLLEGLGDPGQAGIRRAPVPEQQLLGAGTYHVNPKGEAGVPVSPINPSVSMRESLGSKFKDIETKPIKSEVVPPIVRRDILPTEPFNNVSEIGSKLSAQDFISEKKSGQVPKGMTFDEWKQSGPRQSDLQHYEDLQTSGFGAPSKSITGLEGRLLREDLLGQPKSEMPRLELPQRARSEKGGIQIGADIRSLGKVLGSSLYKGEISKIATKELLQNSVDAVRHLGENGKIDVKFGQGTKLDPEAKYVQVSDNGRGMTRQELETVFTDLGASGKRSDVNAVGGFGLAKAAPLLGGEKVEVTSVVNEGGRIVKHTFSGTPDELLEGVNINTVPAGKGETTGTTVRTYVPKETGFYDARDFVKSVANNSSDLKAKINVSSPYNEMPTAGEDYLPKIHGGKEVAFSNPSADIKLIIPSDAKYAERMGVPTQVMNNGMFQNEIRFGGYSTYPSIPNRVLIDIRSKVPEGHPDYPFTANREELRGTVQQQLSDYIRENIINPGMNARSAALKEAYNNIHVLPNSDINFYDVGHKLTPEELDYFSNHPFVHAIGNAINDAIDLVSNMSRAQEWTYKLEKMGIILDQDKAGTTYGIHIPNPGEKKSAILINPFGILDSWHENPSQTAAGIMHTIQHEVAHMAGGGHDEGHTLRIAQIISDMGEKDYEFRKGFEQILTGGTGDYLPEVQDLLSRYTESRGRESTYDDPLYGTGIKSSDKESGGERVLPGQFKSPSGGAIGKLLNVLAESKISRATQDAMVTAEKGRRAAAFEGVKEGGKTGFFKSLGKLGGEYDTVEGPELKLEAKDVDDLYSNIKFNKRITTFEKARTGIALKKLLDGSAVLQRNELILMDRVFGSGTGQQIMELQGGLGATSGIKIAKTANTMKSMMASIDLSAPFRQGLGLVHRKEYWNAFYSMFKQAASHDAFVANQLAIEAHPNYGLSRESGLFIADHNMSTYEEQFMNSYLNDVRELGKVGKVITEPFAASERAYVGFLNKLRFDTFNTLIQKAEKAGLPTYTYHAGEKIPTDLTKWISKYINVSTGRGDLGHLSKYADDLNTVFFSPRLIKSRLTILNPKYYIDAPSFVRKEALKTLLAMGGFTATTSAIGAMLGGQTKLTPNMKNLTNSDYGKVRFNKTRLDPGGGLNQYIVAASQFVTGKSTSSTSGISYPLNNYGQPGRLGKIAGIGNPNYPSFMENKFSPMASLIDNLLSGRKDPSGKPINLPTEIRKRFTPLIIQDIMDLYKSDPDLIGLGIPAALGMSLQTYQDREPSLGGMSKPSLNMNLKP